ncbi:MAG: DegT/DnrJ/EryC1/StrS family aminotransferase [Phycisphaeraceae bacterium]
MPPSSASPSSPVPLLDLSEAHQADRAAFMAAIGEIIDTNAFVLGKATEQFEHDLASYCQATHAIGMSSGTDALLAALMAAEIGPGDEVIVPAFTFFASAGSVARAGAKPVFVDIDPATFNIDPAAAAEAVTRRTRAIMPVHLYGQSADMDAVMALAEREGLTVIEDAAQSIGARYNGISSGTIGHMGALSFYPTKNLGAFGDAGAVLTQDDALAERLRVLRLHGQTDTYQHGLLGGNFRIDGIQSAVLSIKLKHLDADAEARRAAAARYNDLLADTPLQLPQVAAGCHHVFNQYTVRSQQRDALCEHFKAAGIGHRVYYPLALHLQPCFADLGYREGQFPKAEAATQQVVSLPMFPHLTAEQQTQVAQAVRTFYA